MTIQDEPDPEFDRTTARLIHREALRRAALELSTATPSGLESTLARISAEVTAAATAARTSSQEPSVRGTQTTGGVSGQRPDPTEPPPPHQPPP